MFAYKNKKITKRQKQFIDFITSFKETYGYPPTIREIATGLQINSTSSVKKMLDRLIKNGSLEKIPSKARGLNIFSKKLIPLIGTIKAGNPVFSEENITKYIPLEHLIKRTDKTFFLKVDGNSMSDKGIIEGDYLLVRQTDILNNNDIGIFRINGEVTVKTFYRDDKKKEIILIPANNEYKPIHILESDNFEIIGKVIMVIKCLEGSL